MKLIPRPYQVESVQSIYTYFQNFSGNPVLALPTGTGKSVILAMFLESIYTAYHGQRVMVLTHVKELIEQNHEKLISLWPNAPAGIYSAGLGKKEHLTKIIFGGIASVSKKPALFGWVDLVIIDEAHLVSPSEETMYRRFLDALQAVNPHLKVIGMTATPWRLGHGPITEDGIFTDICFDNTSMEAFNQLIKDGYLLPLIPKQTKQMLETDGVHMRGGEFISQELQQAVDKQEVTFAAVKEAIELGHDRHHWLVFATGINHAINICEMLETFGIPAVVVHSKMSGTQRDEAIAGFKSGKYRAAVNVGVLTTGFDFPGIDLIVMLRPTASTVLWVQMLGRGTRPLYMEGYDLTTLEGRLAAIAASSKHNCIAEGQRVLTDSGLVPIELVTTQMKIWDGVDFVNHSGAVYNGIQTVVSYAGLSATGEHLVYTKKGWKQFKECKDKGFAIAVTGIEGQNIQQSQRCYRTENFYKVSEFLGNAMQYLPQNFLEKLLQCARKYCGLPTLRIVKNWKIRYAKMVSKPLYCCSTKMLQSFRQLLPRLWRTGNQILVYRANSYGGLYSGNFGSTQGTTNQQNKQQWALSNWKFGILPGSDKYEQSTRKTNYSSDARFQNKTSGNTICRFNIKRIFSFWFNRRTNNRTILQEVQQTKRRVWDILNAGPRNCFTVEGLLVHNCLVLDFAGNTSRLGPINDPVIPRKKGKGAGVAPVKLCGSCATYNHASVTHCAFCGAEFLFQVKLKAHASTQELIKDDSPVVEIVKVDHITYSVHNKAGKPPAMKVSYFCGLQIFTDYVCFEHEGFAQRKAKQWWKERSEYNFPPSTADALTVTSHLKEAMHLRVWINKKYPEILSCSFDGTAFGTKQAP